ncbi:2-hydroxy-3-keto-5-methylthiopentenyl-1-phosphate phosphatase [Jeotgalibacillus proteolyticus]|uniref:2-hydroxy-3-keto-5-methylthiopentenyl-1-phosphate phosphatase n=1 Tax=Jeotgalibacillus proteolyticus TaxID=2082395 RepID=A0A2S5GA45_9BACL|nr:2-hydroxy-3-keto-5-methylthiopentenyl-1-phosphate phosphatase [Jeotgalibacillus proteolyticus]PPA69866.1 2-hydroxy-3-keto-5-methylthiopentenyl-1-phosphate phosphatase [Jeotgalibacillus proteolyticus]
MKKKRIIFCDFDGTITTSDNIIAIMKEFAPPEWEGIKDRILAQEVSIQEGVGALFNTLPSHKKNAIEDFLFSQIVIRDGFEEFVSYTRKENIELKVVSGGIDFFVYPLLKPYGLEKDIFCNGSDFSGERIRITWPHACDENCSNGCGCCKPSILRTYPAQDYYKIVIGDSVTDLEAAKIADHVYACDDYLADKCEELGLTYTRFHSFHEIIEKLEHQKEAVS